LSLFFFIKLSYTLLLWIIYGLWFQNLFRFGPYRHMFLIIYRLDLNELLLLLHSLQLFYYFGLYILVVCKMLFFHYFLFYYFTSLLFPIIIWICFVLLWLLLQQLNYSHKFCFPFLTKNFIGGNLSCYFGLFKIIFFKFLETTNCRIPTPKTIKLNNNFKYSSFVSFASGLNEYNTHIRTYYPTKRSTKRYKN
jgi:hypothetical protein